MYWRLFRSDAGRLSGHDTRDSTLTPSADFKPPKVGDTPVETLVRICFDFRRTTLDSLIAPSSAAGSSRHGINVSRRNTESPRQGGES